MKIRIEYNCDDDVFNGYNWQEEHGTVLIDAADALGWLQTSGQKYDVIHNGERKVIGYVRIMRGHLR
jgi:hypothetical protein